MIQADWTFFVEPKQKGKRILAQNKDEAAMLLAQT